MGRDRIYKVTSIGRPLDPAFPTNKAVAWLMPVGGLVAAVVSWLHGAAVTDIVMAGFVGLAVVFGAWALGRELAPDDNTAAFIGMAIAFVTLLTVEPPSLLLLFTCLFLVRIANRSVGLPARISDATIVAALTLWTVYVTESPLLGAAGALAFVFDATLRDPQRYQWIFAGVCLAGAIALAFVFGTGFDVASVPAGTQTWLVAIISIVYTVVYLRTRSVEAVGDVTGVMLSVSRVRAGMFIGLLVPALGLVQGIGGTVAASANWATLAGVGLGGMVGFFRPDRLADG